MKIVYSLEEISPLEAPIAVTIGMFDGVHLGHQYLLKELKKYGTPVVITFSNHPSTITKLISPLPLCSLEERLRRLEKAEVALTVILPFTKELANTPYDKFLENLKTKLPFSAFVRGKGDAFGHHSEGTEERVKKLQKKLHFKAVYLKKISVDGHIISSQSLREKLLSGKR